MSIENNPDVPNRKHPIHGIMDIRGNPVTIVFDTVCTKDRVPWLANEVVHECLYQTWTKINDWRVGRFVIMPDHVHYVAAGNVGTADYEKWVTHWKRIFSRGHAIKTQRWQSDHWETRIRNRKHYDERLEYMMLNPVRKKLVENANDWQFQGEVYELMW